MKYRKMYREPIAMGRKPGLNINGVVQKEERNIQPEKNEETRIQKTEERLRKLQDIFKHSNIRIIVVPEEKRKSKKLKTSWKK